VLDTDNVKALRRNGFVIWLKADQQTLLKRMSQDSGTLTRRPTLTGKGTLKELEEMISAREPFYEKASQIQIDTSTLDVDAVVEHISVFYNDTLRMG
jgi:shikimate kinase